MRTVKKARKRMAVAFMLPLVLFASLAAPEPPEATAHTHDSTSLGDAEYQLKAAFIYNFTKFIQWPDKVFDSTDEPFFVCIFGEDPFGAAIDALADKSAQGHPFIITRINSNGATPGQIAGCRILFVASSESSRLKPLLATLPETGVLTVSDMGAFAAHGGMIGLDLHDNRIRLAINLSAARAAGMKISSKLLRLAEVVDE